jgi:hypothetical protein
MSRVKRYVVKSLMFISSYFPLYIMLLILHHDKCYRLQDLEPKVTVFVFVMAICIILSLLSVCFIKISTGTKPLKIDEIERPDDTIISYMMTYIIPILTTSFLTKGEILVNILLFLLIGYLYIRLNLLYLNPLWSMFGYLSFRVNSDVVIVTNIQYSRLKQLKANNKAIKGLYIANDIFIAQEKENSVNN